jgi:GGDEF domain-containing protein
VLPDDHHDERASERIEAFLEGPPQVRRARPRRHRSDGVARPRRTVAMDTRADWNTALRHEDARIARYGRPAAVVVVDVAVAAAGRLDRVAEEVGQAIRRLARETDRVARMSPRRFHVLLPETTGPEAAALGRRIRRICDDLAADPTGRVLIRTAVASPGQGESLTQALHGAEADLTD